MASGSLKLYLSANSERLTKELNKAKKAVSNFSIKSTELLNRFKIQIGVTAAAVVAGLGAMIKSSLSANDNIQKLSIRLNESTEALSQYQHVAEITGVSFQDIANSFAKLQKGVADAEDGLSTASTALDDLGVNIKDIIDLKPSEQFETIADAIVKIESPAKRTQIAMDLMGRSGSRMLSTMAEGGEGIRRLREEYDAMGGTLTDVEANQIAAANDAITRIGATARITGQVLAVELAPVIQEVADTIRGSLPDIIKFLRDLNIKVGPTMTELTGQQKSLIEQINETTAQIKIMQEVAGDGLPLDLAMKKIDLANFKEALISVNEQLDKFKKPVRIFGDEEGAAIAAAIETKIATIEKGLLDEETALALDYSIKYNFIDKNVSDTERAEKIKLDLKSKYLKKSQEITKRNADSEYAIEAAKFSNIASGVKNLTGIIAKQGKFAFYAHKVAAVSEAAINTSVAITKALPNFPLAFAVGAAGAAQIAAIVSTSIGGGSSGGTTAGLTQPSIEDPTAFPAQQQQQVQEPLPEQRIIIQLGDRTLAEVVTEGLVIGQDNDTINLRTENGLERVIVA